MSKKIKKLIKRVLFCLFNSLGLIAAVSCRSVEPATQSDIKSEPVPEKKEEANVCVYGMPANYKMVTGKVYGDINNDGNLVPVPGIQYYFDGEFYTTTEDGTYAADIWDNSLSVEITFVDIDGNENGSFKPKTEVIDFIDSRLIEKDITLE